MLQMDIYEEFSAWLDNLLENNEMPADTKAFCFNLYEESVEENLYSAQIIAANSFDASNYDWACEEVWSSEEDVFVIDISDESEKNWQHVLELFREMAVNYLAKGNYRDVLIKHEAVGIGFVDGDIDIIFKS